MFYHLQYIHLFRPFLKYTPATSPLPAHVSPRRICTANAGAISKLMRLYKKLYNLRQICNIAVYMVHSACTIHILNLPEKTAKRDIIHGVKHLEEIAEDWLCARRSLSILSVLARKWKIELPEEAALVLQRTDEKYGTVSTSDVPSPNRSGPSIAQSPQSLPSPTNNNVDPYSPTTQYTTPSAQAMSLDLPTSTMSTDLLNNLAASGIPNLQRLQGQTSRQMAQPITTTSIDSLAMNAWAMPPVTRSVPNYPQAFAPVHNHNPMGSTPTSSRSAAQHRQLSPSSIYAIDGQDWYLKDGVNWQQNFETWNLGTAAAATGSNAPGPSNNAGAGGSSASPGMGDASMFMFRGMSGSEMDGTGFESLGSMGSLDHLPGLD